MLKFQPRLIQAPLNLSKLLIKGPCSHLYGRCKIVAFAYFLLILFHTFASHCQFLKTSSPWFPWKSSFLGAQVQVKWEYSNLHLPPSSLRAKSYGSTAPIIELSLYQCSPIKNYFCFLQVQTFLTLLKFSCWNPILCCFVMSSFSQSCSNFQEWIYTTDLQCSSWLIETLSHLLLFSTGIFCKALLFFPNTTTDLPEHLLDSPGCLKIGLRSTHLGHPPCLPPCELCISHLCCFSVSFGSKCNWSPKLCCCCARCCPNRKVAFCSRVAFLISSGIVPFSCNAIILFIK